MTTRTITLTIVIALLGIPCAVSLADPVDDYMDYQGVALNENVQLYFAPAGFTGSQVRAGQMKIHYQDNDYLGYCVDVYHHAGDAQVSLLAPSAVPGGIQAAFLFETYRLGVSSSKEAAALQTAIWEVLNETVDNYDISDGEFRIGGNSPVATLAQTMLDSVPDSYNPAPATIILHTESKQDMMIGGEDIPEPGTMVLLSIGGFMAVIRRRRQHKA